MDAYELHEARLLQLTQATSAAGAVSVSIGPVPAGKIWTILHASYVCSHAETKSWYFSVYRSTFPCAMAVTRPAALAVIATWPNPMLTEGLEIKLYPGEYLFVTRDSATAGSTMQIAARYIETDLPFYSYDEPQNKVMRSVQKHGSTYRASGAISPAGGGVGPGGHGGPSGGGGSEPV